LGAIAVAYFTARGSRSFFPLLNGSELAALYCFVFLFIAAIGGGTWGVDKLRAKEK
jgi:putative oxidoreductase